MLSFFLCDFKSQKAPKRLELILHLSEILWSPWKQLQSVLMKLLEQLLLSQDRKTELWKFGGMEVFINFFYVKTLYIFNSYFNWIVFSSIWNQGRALNCQIVHSDPVRQIKLLSNQRTISRSAFDGKILVMWKLRDGQVLDSFSFENKNSTCTSMDVGKNDMVAIGKKHDQLTRNTSWILCNFTQFLLQK